MTAICPICGKQFTASKPRRFCSIRCRNTNNARQLKPKLLHRTCPVCGKAYTTGPNRDGSPHNLYCSPECGHIGAGRKRRAPRTTHICPICGKRFHDVPSRRRVYCSRKCGGEARRQTARRVEAICDYCGKVFISPDGSNWNTRPQQRFCSEICKGKGIAQEHGLNLREQTTFICENCGKPFTRTARSDREYHYCSRECYWQHYRGENHHCWQGGTDRYYGPNWDEQRLKSLERDNYTCQECGIVEDGMNVHHIIPRSEFGQDWKAMNDLSNLVTLCHSCHARLHIEHLNGS